MQFEEVNPILLASTVPPRSSALQVTVNRSLWPRFFLQVFDILDCQQTECAEEHGSSTPKPRYLPGCKHVAYEGDHRSHREPSVAEPSGMREEDTFPEFQKFLDQQHQNVVDLVQGGF